MNPAAFSGLPDPPTWARREFAWPLSLIVGFGSFWLGLQVPLPGLAALLAAGAILPLYGQMQQRGDYAWSIFVVLGWLIGCGAAAVGMAVEGDLPKIIWRVPFAAQAIERWIEPGRAPGDSVLSDVLWLCGFVALGMLVAPLARGAVLLVWLAFGTGILSGMAAWVADRASRLAIMPLTAGSLGWAPLLVIALAALVTAAQAVASPQPLRPWSGAAPAQRLGLAIGLPVALLAAAVHPLTAPAWAAWLHARLPG